MNLNDIKQKDYNTFTAPFLKNGIIIDSCVLYELINGIVETRISRRKLDKLSEFEQINVVFDLLHITDSWNKLYVTPHILTETCRHLEQTYNKTSDYKKVVEEVFPLLDGMGEYQVSKDNFCREIDMLKPVIESGDISIFVTANGFSEKNEKIAILTKDRRIKGKYENIANVLIIDYQAISYNFV